MQQRILGKTGLKVSVLGFGGAPVGILETEQSRVAKVLHSLLDHGVNLIDTAAMYRGSEAAIGNAVADRRDDYVLVTKCGEPGSSADAACWSPAAIRDSVDRSLKRLKTDHLDVVLLHSCPLPTLQRGEALQALVDARDAGKIRFAGYSGDNEAAAYAVELPDVAVLQTSINICDQANIHGVLPDAARNSVGVIAKRPLANAAWKDLSEQPGFYGEYAKTYTQRLASMQLNPASVGVEADGHPAWLELALRFTISHPEVTTAIIGTTNPAHALANVDLAEKGPLAEQAVSRIHGAFQQAERDAGIDWPAQM